MEATGDDNGPAKVALGPTSELGKLALDWRFGLTGFAINQVMEQVCRQVGAATYLTSADRH
jgi:hypothetical protein